MEPERSDIVFCSTRFFDFFLPLTICVLAQKIIAVSATTTDSSIGADGSLEIVKKNSQIVETEVNSLISPQRPPWGQRKVVVVVRWPLCMGR